MIDSRHMKQIGNLSLTIEGADDFNLLCRQILTAAVWAMADEFSDITFEEIATKDRDFFCSCVRHHWAHQGGEVTPCSYTHRAIRCPISDEHILDTIRRFERNVRLIWVPKKARVA
jgi:hypothetical protein